MVSTNAVTQPGSTAKETLSCLISGCVKDADPKLRRRLRVLSVVGQVTSCVILLHCLPSSSAVPLGLLSTGGQHILSSHCAAANQHQRPSCCQLLRWPLPTRWFTRCQRWRRGVGVGGEGEGAGRRGGGAEARLNLLHEIFTNWKNELRE